MGVVVLVSVMAVDVALISSRVQRVRLELPASGLGTTFVLIGSDSRAFVDDETDRHSFGDAGTVPGTRADLVFVLQVPSRGAPALLAIPRDLVVFSADGSPVRLGLIALGGLQGLVDALCGSLGIAADHVVSIDFSGLRDLVDELGGVVVDVPVAIRDPMTGLDLGTTGPHRLDGADALAYVRSRQGEIRQDGVWVPEPDGAVGRVARARAVLGALAAAIPNIIGNPLRTQRVAWVGAGALTVDTGTGVPDMVRLADVLRQVAATPSANLTLPTAPLHGGIPLALGRWPFIPPQSSRLLTTDALAVLERFGVPFPDGACTPRLLRQNWIVDSNSVLSGGPEH